MEATLLSAVATEQAGFRGALERVADFYKRAERWADREQCLDRVAGLLADGDERAKLLLEMGGEWELREDWEGAARHYVRALAENPTDPDLAYDTYNRVGYSLSQLGNVERGEIYCRTAIGLDPNRLDAHLNLGLILRGQARFIEAAHAFIAATERAPEDRRSLSHLRAMLRAHPDAFHGAPGIASKMKGL
jgi:tetratricopeptide (TPR) repeat protein